MGVSSLISEKVPAYIGNYTKGRTAEISEITIHHMSGKLTARRCGELFQVIGRNGSTHYGIGYAGEIANYVDENDTAWANSNWEANCRAVTIETSNNVNAYPWSVSDASLKSLIKLVADIAKRNKLGKLVKGKNLTWHQMYAATDCPGPYLLSKIDYICDEVNRINGYFADGSKGEIAGTDKPRLADELILYFKGKTTGTNSYGWECAVDKNGVVLENPTYRGNSEIPIGGKVISAHGKAAKWLKKTVKMGYLVWAENGTLKVSQKQHRSVDNVNGIRSTGMLCVYRDRATSNTNPYGYEVAVDKNGIILNAPVYGKGHMEVPKDGFVISGHANGEGSGGEFVKKYCKKGKKVKFDGKIITID